MLRFQGERDFSLSPTELFAKLRDARFLVACIPNASVQGEPQPDKAICSIRPNFSFAGATLQTAIEVVEADEPARLRYLLSSTGIGSSSEVATALTIVPFESGSKVQWSADVQKLGGLLKAVPSGLIKGAAQKTIDEIWDE